MSFKAWPGGQALVRGVKFAFIYSQHRQTDVYLSPQNFTTQCCRLLLNQHMISTHLRNQETCFMLFNHSIWFRVWIWQRLENVILEDVMAAHLEVFYIQLQQWGASVHPEIQREHKHAAPILRMETNKYRCIYTELRLVSVEPQCFMLHVQNIYHICLRTCFNYLFTTMESVLYTYRIYNVHTVPLLSSLCRMLSMINQWHLTLAPLSVCHLNIHNK